MGITARQPYRPDIDGLRAIAVCLVVAFHLQTVMSHGGFIGVDVFFVISGFLITSILIRDLDNSTYSIKTFYVRRIRRIAPALLAVLTATTIVAYLALLPSELKDYANSLLSAIFSFSNLYFWQHSGYFDAQSSTQPLLHTWSLAVEEQFYIVFPLLLAFLHKHFRKWLVPILFVLAICSFIFSARAAYTNPNLAFYSPLSRAWELLCGSLLALAPIPGMQHRFRREFVALWGLILLLFGVVAYHHYTVFPGITALAPCIGTVLIIGSGSGGWTMVSRVLAWRPLVFVGLISYSLYLWHWPLIVFESMGLAVTPKSRLGHEAFIIAIAFGLAVLSWRFIERPFRGHNKATPSRQVFQVAALCASVPAVLACAFLLFKGMPFRFKQDAVQVASYLDQSNTPKRYRTGSCFLTSNLTVADFKQAECLRKSSDQKNVLLFGDSHAAHLYTGLSSVYPDINFQQATAVSCAPIVSTSLTARKRPQDCVGLVDFILHRYLPTADLDLVVLAAHWTPGDLPDLESTIHAVQEQGIKVLLIGPAIEYDAAEPKLLAYSIQRSDPAYPQRHRLDEASQLDRKMAQLAAGKWHVDYFSYFNALCATGTCQTYASPAVPLEEDQAHLTAGGSMVVAEKIREKNLIVTETSVRAGSL